MQDGPRLGRIRQQRWSQAPADGGSIGGLEAKVAAEFRALRQEVEELKAQLAARPVPTSSAATPTPAKSSARRSLGRGLDALMSPAPASWWHEGIFPDPTRPPGKPPESGK